MWVASASHMLARSPYISAGMVARCCMHHLVQSLIHSVPTIACASALLESTYACYIPGNCIAARAPLSSAILSLTYSLNCAKNIGPAHFDEALATRLHKL